ncbi:MAG TPA: hypothetical protein VH833_09010 [Gemmatimonadales bacterium]|jgi:hypothetical protein
MTRMVTRHLVLSFLPLALGFAAGWWFGTQQQGCAGLVGPLFAAKCTRVQMQYQLWFQIAGTALGGFLAAGIGIWLERRRTRRSATPAANAEPAP